MTSKHAEGSCSFSGEISAFGRISNAGILIALIERTHLKFSGSFPQAVYGNPFFNSRPGHLRFYKSRITPEDL